MEHLIQILIVIRSLLITLGSHQVVVGIHMSVRCLRVVSLQICLIRGGCIFFTLQSLQRHSPHNLYLSLILVEISIEGIRILTILVEQHLRTIYPVDSLSVSSGVDIGHTGVHRSDDGFLQSTTRRVSIPSVGIVLTGFHETLVCLGITPQVQLTTAYIVQHDGIVDVRTYARLSHLLHCRNGDTQSPLEVALHQQ